MIFLELNLFFFCKKNTSMLCNVLYVPSLMIWYFLLLFGKSWRTLTSRGEESLMCMVS